MTICEMKMDAYTTSWWGNKEISLITGLGGNEVSKIKQEIVKLGGSVKGHGQKVYRDVVCKHLRIDIDREMHLLNIILGGREDG